MWVAFFGDSEGSKSFILFLNGAKDNPVSVVDFGCIVVDNWTVTPLNGLQDLVNAARV